jgi:transketolase
MRTIFIKTLTDLAKKNPDIMLLTGDLGYSVLENFIDTFSSQFVNAGMTEQSMTGIAAGLAMENKIPVLYSIIPFITMRNFEQIRNDICYQNLNVKIVGTGTGFSYGPYGHTHHALEDIAILRTLPGLTIFSPSDPVETAFVTKQAFKIAGPVYIRLGKTSQIINSRYDKLQFAKGSVVTEGSDISILSTGTMVPVAVEVASLLSKKGFSTRVVSMHTLKPFDHNIVQECVKKTKALFTLEEHHVIGGLGSMVSEGLAEYGRPVRFKRLGVQDRFTDTIGTSEYMRTQNNLAVGQIKDRILKIMQTI